MFENLLRDHIKRLVYEPTLRKKPLTNRFSFVQLDANEHPLGSPTAQDYNRYADDSLAHQIKATLQIIKRVTPDQICLTQGTADALQLIFTAFCEPNEDNILLCTPTSIIYERSALIHGAKVKKIALTTHFQLNIENIAAAIDNYTKLIVLASPNNPTGNALAFQDIEVILNNFDGIVILDEAYINFSRQRSFLASLAEYPNLIILQSFSRSWGLAGVPSGMLFAQAGIIEVLYQLQNTPHNTATQQLILQALHQIELVNQWTKDLVALRKYLTAQLEKLSIVKRVNPSEANFLLVDFGACAQKIFSHLSMKNILVKDVSSDVEGCLRISVGSLQDNEKLIVALKQI